jgi:GT2 family glycosyltransferase
MMIESVLKSHGGLQSVVVSSDAVGEGLPEYVGGMRAKVPFPFLLVQRAHKGAARRGQTRNNGVRAIRSLVKDPDMLYFLDGDVCPDPGHFKAVQNAASCEVIVGRVIRLSQAASELFKHWLRTPRPFSLPLVQRIAFAGKVAKVKAAAWMRHIDLPYVRKRVPPYWPDLRSGNFAVRASAFFCVNGFDESMVGWGAEDSDLGLRLYSTGARVTTFPWGCRAYHLWHPSAARPTSARLRARLSSNSHRARYGLDLPFDQAESELQISN